MYYLFNLLLQQSSCPSLHWAPAKLSSSLMLLHVRSNILGEASDIRGSDVKDYVGFGAL